MYYIIKYYLRYLYSFGDPSPPLYEVVANIISSFWISS